jgi:cell fate regulator YaaT (PSP1 superfamily)
MSDGDSVVVETAKGLELGECVYGNHWVTDERVIPPLRAVARVATENDLRVAALNKKREKEAFEIGQEKIRQHGLDMKLVDVECSFEGNKIIFFFASEGRVDFRDLVKDLASVFRTRIELRQIGVRDEAKMLGGLGICGRPFCCSQFLDDFAPVSTKMAKTQSMSLNPAKISGSCGRLMCCLRYEQEAYEELVKNVPKNGAFVQTPAGYGNITQVNLLRQKIKVRLDGPEQAIKTFDVDEVAAVPGGRPRPGEPLPVVLQPKEPEQVPAEPAEALPNLIPPENASIPAENTPKPEKEGERRPRRRGGRGRRSGGEGGREQPQQPREASGEKKPQGDRQKKPRQENRPERKEGQHAGSGQHAGEGAPRGDGSRRHRRRRPKAPGEGKAEQ